VAYAQSFALWQQATIKFTCHDHSIIARLHHIFVVLFVAHIPFVVNHTFYATLAERLQQLPSFMYIKLQGKLFCLKVLQW